MARLFRLVVRTVVYALAEDDREASDLAVKHGAKTVEAVAPATLAAAKRDGLLEAIPLAATETPTRTVRGCLTSAPEPIVEPAAQVTSALGGELEKRVMEAIRAGGRSVREVAIAVYGGKTRRFTNAPDRVVCLNGAGESAVRGVVRKLTAKDVLGKGERGQFTLGPAFGTESTKGG